MVSVYRTLKLHNYRYRLGAYMWPQAQLRTQPGEGCRGTRVAPQGGVFSGLNGMFCGQKREELIDGPPGHWKSETGALTGVFEGADRWQILFLYSSPLSLPFRSPLEEILMRRNE